jgi:exonuclease SbcC
MKPLYLEMQAFGPYPNVQTVDFTRLAGCPLFLIHGPTGSGKTTIFDALCYALYGKTTGARSGEQMRCQYAAEDVRTKIMFDFRLGKKAYRVVRLPTQQRPKKRGAGTTTMEHRAELWDRTGSSGSDEGALLAGKARDVDKRIEELIGFEVDQFRQVVLLPQGEFRELLLATSQDREKILETLFGTWVYARIQQGLSQKSAEIRAECSDRISRRDALLDAAGTATDTELNRKIEERQKTLKKLGLRVAATQKAYESAQEVQAKADEVEALFEEREDALEESRALTRRKREMSRKGDDLKWARKAAGLIDIHAACEEKQAAREEAETDLAGAEEDLAEAARAAKQAAAQEVKARTLEPDVVKLSEEISSLRAMRPKVTSLDSLTGKLESGRKTIAALRAEIEKGKTRVTEVEEKIAATEAKIETLQPLANTVGAVDIKLGDIRRTADDRKKHLEGTEQLASALGDLEKASAETQRAGHRLAKAEVEMQDAEGAWTSSSAYNIAQQLTPGDPCPVCGSREHPHPAAKTAAHISEVELTQRRSAYRNADRAFKEAQKHEVDLKARVETLRSKVDDLGARLGSNVSKSPAQLEKAYDELLHQHKQAVDARQEIDKGRRGLKDLKESVASAGGTLKAQDDAVRKQEQDLSNLESTLKERLVGVPENLRNVNSLQERLEQALERLEGLKQVRHEAEKAARHAEKQLAEAESRLQAAGKAVAKAGKAEQKARKDFARRRRGAGFTTDDGFRGAIMEADAMAECEAAIDGYKEKIALSGARVGHARAKTRGLRRPRLDLIAKRLAKHRVAFEAVSRQYGAVEQELGALKKTLREIKRINRALARQEKELQVVGRLADVANGKNDQRITFQRFVLSSLLDQVTAMANERLRLMSEGRYTLHRSVVARDLRLAGGLDLEVFDSFSGDQRSVNTLSGGEMFLASLSMALGLADVVQSFSGGIRLDSVFIDEGFGSLDGETLDHAIETLVGLQSDGRMVGVISHVPELKERIDVRLEVRPGSHGSTIHLVGT